MSVDSSNVLGLAPFLRSDSAAAGAGRVPDHLTSEHFSSSNGGSVSIPNGIRTRAAALKARNSASLETFKDLL
jgi:hypothetical protein